MPSADDTKERGLAGGSGYQITFDMRRSPFSVTYSPGEQSPQESKGGVGTWLSIHQHAKVWAGYLKRELDAPDLWAAIERQRQLAESAVAVGIPNTPFTEQEQHSISAQLDEIKAELAANHQLEQHHVKQIEDGFEFLKE